MITFKEFLKEGASIENIMAKIQGAQTEEGLDSLEKYYSKRTKETEVGESDDITVRDAITGRRAEIKAAEAEKKAAEEEAKQQEDV